MPWINEVNGLWWAWASVCAGGCGELVKPLPWGWRFSTDEEFTAFRQAFAVGSWQPGGVHGANHVCAAAYFEDIHALGVIGDQMPTFFVSNSIKVHKHTRRGRIHLIRART